MLGTVLHGAFGEYEWSFYNCSHFLKGKRHFPFCWLQHQATNILLVCLSDMQRSNNETEAHSLPNNFCCAGVTWRCGTGLFSMASQNSAYSAGTSRGNKGEMQQAEYGRGAASPCSSSLSSSSLAVFNRCLFLPSWPGGEALGTNGELMEEM